jgi:uncharacterized protein
MSGVHLLNGTKGVPLARRLEMADTFWRRLAGLLGRAELAAGSALAILPCRSVHTHFMRFAIDVLFVNRQWQVVAAVSNLRPWRHAAGGPDAWAAVELPVGTIATTGTAVGDRLQLAAD